MPEDRDLSHNPGSASGPSRPVKEQRDGTIEPNIEAPTEAHDCRPEDAEVRGDPARLSQGAAEGIRRKKEIIKIPATEAERRNGWDDMTISRYVHERDLAAAEKIDPHSLMNQRLRRPRRANGKRWSFPMWRGS